MIAKYREKQRASSLRLQGYSYSEILKEVQVSRSSLSLWLGKLIVPRQYQKILVNKRNAGRIKANQARKTQRVQRELDEYLRAKTTIGRLTQRDLHLIATTLYWAEGTKQRSSTSARTSICNSDPAILCIFYIWLLRIGFDASNIICRLYIHENYRPNEHEILQYWNEYFPNRGISWRKTVYKKDQKIKEIVRYNHGSSSINPGWHSNTYYGLLSLTVKKSTWLNRYLAGTARAIAEQCPVV